MIGNGWKTRATRRRFLRGAGVATAGAAALALAACGGDDDDAAPAVPASTGAGSGAAAAPVQGKQGGTARFTLAGTANGDPPTLYPFENPSYLTVFTSAPHYSRLLRTVSGPEISNTDYTRLEGELAKGLPEQPDPRTYIFSLKPGVKFHNKAPVNGREVTASDVVTSYEAFIATSANAGTWKSVVDTVDAPDAKTVRFTLKEPFAPFLVTHASSQEGVWLIPAETIASEQAKKDPVGTGPWIFRQYEPGVAIRWDRNPTFFDGPLPYFERAEAVLLKDTQRILAALQSGELDMSVILGSGNYAEAKQKLDPKGAHIIEAPSEIGAIIFNFDEKPWGDKRVRQALSMALDRDGMLQVQDPTGKGEWQSHISASLSPYYISPKNEREFGPNAKYFKKDIAEAKKLLAAAGFPNGLSFKMYANIDRYGAAAKQRWELIASTIREAGFTAELVYQEYGAYIQSTFLGKFDGGIATAPIHGAPRDPDALFTLCYSASSTRHNWGGTPIPELADLEARFTKQRQLLKTEERVEAIKEIQRTMAESMLVVPYHGTPGYTYAQPWLQNYHHKWSAAYTLESLAKASFADERIKKG